MEIICIGKQGINLSNTLYVSKTSRHILRFYHPMDMGWGIKIQESTVSNAISLLSELRWYIMRYMADVIIEDTRYNVYISFRLAQAVYENRSVMLSETWGHMYRDAILEDGSIYSIPAGVDTPVGTQVAFLVWCMPDEEP